MVFTNINELQAVVGKALPESDWMQVTQEMVNNFALATNDHQWIHVDPEKAKHSPFQTTIAHGFFSVSIVSRLLAEVITIKSAKMAINYGLENIRFPHHVAVGAEIRLQASLNKIEHQPNQMAKLFVDFIIELKNIEKPACCGQFIFLVKE